MFSNRLIQWYWAAHRQLPWRKSRDPYHIWVSEVMLQQTQVKTAIPYYLAFLDHFPTVQALANADLGSVLKLWEGLGYYARARNLHKAAKIIAHKLNGIIPDNIHDFKQLPGVGDYIGAAVQSIVFGHPIAVVDGNVKRVIARLYCLDIPVNRPAAHKTLTSYAQDLLDPEDPATFNQAMMELGALVCTPKHPACFQCPVSIFCKAFKTSGVDQFPKRDASKKTPLIHIAAGIVNKNGRLLITQRKPEGLLGGLWEFPGGKLEKNETAESACVREIKEETNIKVKIDTHLTTVHHAYTHFKIKMEVFCCSYVSGCVCLNGPVNHHWIQLKEISRFAFPKANLKFIKLLSGSPGTSKKI
ncbi:MAG: A/G-specific adenine glycosylase [Pseudomonadota bacterium]